MENSFELAPGEVPADRYDPADTLPQPAPDAVFGVAYVAEAPSRHHVIDTGLPSGAEVPGPLAAAGLAVAARWQPRCRAAGLADFHLSTTQTYSQQEWRTEVCLMAKPGYATWNQQRHTVTGHGPTLADAEAAFELQLMGWEALRAPYEAEQQATDEEVSRQLAA